MHRTTAARPARVTVLGLWRRLATLAAQLHDPHIFVAPPPSKSRVRLPTRVRRDSVFLREHVESLPAGSRLQRLGGVAVGELLARCLAWAGASRERGARRIQAELFPGAIQAADTGILRAGQRSRRCSRCSRA